jgi:hypothetical protein
MKQDLVSYAFTEDDFTALKQQINDIDVKVDEFAIELHIDNKRELKTLGDRSLPFTEQSFLLATQQKHLVPSFVNMDEFGKDLTLFKQCKELIKLLEVILERLNDTSIAAGADAFLTARKFYDAVKAAVKSNIPGASVAFDELRKRYIRDKGKNDGQNNDNTPEKKEEDKPQ